MSLRIAFDLDGVLADMEGELGRQAKVLFGSPAGPAEGPDDDERVEDDEMAAPLPTRMSLTPRQQGRLWRHVRSLENFWETLEELEPGVLARLATTASDRRWEIIFLTSRPSTRGATSQVQSQRWLESKGFSRPSVYVVQSSRGLIAASLRLDAVVDDRIENCMDVVADSKARAFLVGRADSATPLPTGAKRLGVGAVSSVAECLEALVHLETATADTPGAMDKVKRLLGLKKPPT